MRFSLTSKLDKTAEIEIKFQNDTVKQKMDGVIVATPSGSTGHSFSLVDQFCMRVRCIDNYSSCSSV